MDTTHQKTGRFLLLLSAVLWALATLVSFAFFSPINSLTNPFLWWLSFMEVIELLVVIPSNVDLLPQLFSGPATREKILIWMGLPATIGWVVGLIGMYKIDDSRRVKLLQGVGIFCFVPLLVLISTGSAFYRGGNRTESMSQSPSG